MWSPDELAEAAANALESRVRALCEEQAVRGIDACSEVELQTILRRGYEAAGYGVIAEQPYPGEPERRPNKPERERCDIVLTPRPGQVLIDPVLELREQDKALGTLFEPFAADGPAPAPEACAIEDAHWLEVKTVGQFTYTRGVPGPNRAYSSELVAGPAADAVKLEWDRFIAWAGVLVVVFTEDETTARHDLGVLMHRLLDRELPVLSPAIRCGRIPDFIGNRVCAAALIPVSKPPPLNPRPAPDRDEGGESAVDEPPGRG
ncbi:MAG: hypothetical protein ACKVU4_12845 [Phycisphaerales bacterium]